MAITINEGTSATIYTKLSSGTEVQVVKLDVGSGTAFADFGGTITAVNNVANLAKGTVTVASIPAIGARHADAFQTVVSSGTSAMGTIKPAVSGSSIYITDLVISAGTATNVEIASGGTSTPVIGTLHLNTYGGAVMNFNTPPYTASGSALVYKQSVDGALSITCTGYVD